MCFLSASHFPNSSNIEVLGAKTNPPNLKHLFGTALRTQRARKGKENRSIRPQCSVSPRMCVLKEKYREAGKWSCAWLGLLFSSPSDYLALCKGSKCGISAPSGPPSIESGPRTADLALPLPFGNCETCACHLTVSSACLKIGSNSSCLLHLGLETVIVSLPPCSVFLLSYCIGRTTQNNDV